MSEPCDFPWLREQLENNENEDVSPCLACGCEWCEDDLNPETGLCVRCTPTLVFELAVDDYDDDDNPFQRERDWWRRAITCLK